MRIEGSCRSRRSQWFLQFSKYVTGRGGIGIEMAFPLSAWSEHCYPEVVKLLDIQGIQYRIERTGREDNKEFVNIAFGEDTEAAATIAQRITGEMFGVDEASEVAVRLFNVSPRTEAVRR